MRTPCHGLRHSPRVLRARRRRGAFTIVELMVVIGIIALLTSLLLVGLGVVRRQASTSACLSSLRQLSNAHVAYANVYKECFADVGLPHGGGGDPRRSFVTTLRDFGMDESALRSTLDQSPHWPPELGGEGAAVAFSGGEPVYRRSSYGMNNYLSRTYSPTLVTGAGAPADRFARITRPSEVICFLLMAERGQYAASDHPHVENWGVVASNPAALAATQCAINAFDRRKPSGDSRSNWSFVDGHAGTLRFDEAFASSSENRFNPGL